MNAVALTPATPAPKVVESGLKYLPKEVARKLVQSPEWPAIAAECRAVIAVEGPAKGHEFAMIIERLALHYPENRLTPSERKLLLTDWLRLMGHLPADILAAAADAFVMSPARFFPTPGQLNKLAEPMWTARKALAKRAREALDMAAA